MIAITGASGHLGHLVIKSLLAKTDASNILALVRSPEKAQDLRELGVVVRAADYDQPESYVEALKGVDKLLLISGSAVGQRVAQHKAVIDAAKANGVALLAYTSILKADSSPILLAAEHKETEALIKASGVPFTLLRNGWYSENYTENLAHVLAHGAVIGHAGEGRVATASRADFADAAAVVLTSAESHAGKIYELTGDADFSMADYAAVVAELSAKEIAYVDMPFEDYKNALIGAGVPEGFATVLADADAAIKGSWLSKNGSTLSDLIGRPTTPIKESIKAAL
ncbi:SDR family oxidoreductase [uncultured Cohaesibacter sp.]|uniref:SDR family oxidoreductase n=1 Tax=uncultured Cohaesibacter sp. TaxID=1002546 RepID=UPI0029302BE3|nr:SDR family oxidoreductase [uncultured Cohaesibacter sp.]